MLDKLTGPVPATAEHLEDQGSWPEAWHVWRQEELDALVAALGSGRPLLVKGEPGVGKSQIARAAAARLGWRFLYEVVTPRMEPQDLKWRFDAVARLADAVPGGELKEVDHYYAAGVLWQALDPLSAVRRAGGTAGTVTSTDAVSPARAPATPTPTGAVLLIDEIDKADSDLPNSLLEVLANRGFTTPWGLRVPAPGRPAPPVLFVITSNDERELPLAFMRRCVVLEIKAPDEEADGNGFIAWLKDRARAHFADMDASVMDDAADQVRRDRAGAPQGQGARAGLAEYLDLLRALDDVASGRPAEQRKWLAYLSPYLLRKQGQSQAVAAGATNPRPSARTNPRAGKG